MDDQTHEYPQGKPCPWVSTASFAREGDSLIMTLDGEETTLPGGYASTSLSPGGKVKVHVWGEFEAGAVDMLATEDGS